MSPIIDSSQTFQPAISVYAFKCSVMVEALAPRAGRVQTRSKCRTLQLKSDQASMGQAFKRSLAHSSNTFLQRDFWDDAQ